MNSCRATRWQPAGEASSHTQYHHHGGKSPRVCGSNTKQQTSNIFAGRNGKDNSENQAVHDQSHASLEEQAFLLALTGQQMEPPATGITRFTSTKSCA